MAKILTEDDIEKALVKFLTGAGWGYSEINAMTAVREKAVRRHGS